MPIRRTSQTIAMNLRFYVYAAEPGAEYNEYPNGAGSSAVLMPYTEAEIARNARKRDAMLSEWLQVDPEGHALWTAAVEALRKDQELTGWAALMEEQHGMRLVDPCRYCRECRSRR